jgi:hypothetical protein
MRRGPIRSSPDVKVCGSQQVGAIGLPLPRALQLAEHIPASAYVYVPIIRHGTGWAGLVAVGHG